MGNDTEQNPRIKNGDRQNRVIPEVANLCIVQWTETMRETRYLIRRSGYKKYYAATFSFKKHPELLDETGEGKEGPKEKSR